MFKTIFVACLSNLSRNTSARLLKFNFPLTNWEKVKIPKKFPKSQNQNNAEIDHIKVFRTFHCLWKLLIAKKNCKNCGTIKCWLQLLWTNKPSENLLLDPRCRCKPLKLDKFKNYKLCLEQQHQKWQVLSEKPLIFVTLKYRKQTHYH